VTEAAVPDSAPDVEADLTVDNRGRGCASGIAQVQRALEDLPDGGILTIKSTDKRAEEEYPRLAERTPHELLAIETDRDHLLRTEYTTYIEVHRD